MIELICDQSPDYENAGIYASSLLEMFSDYKAFWKNLQMLDEDMQDGLPQGTEIVQAIMLPEIQTYLTDFLKSAKAAASSDLNSRKSYTAASIIAQLRKDNKNIPNELTTSPIDMETIKQYTRSKPAEPYLPEKGYSTYVPSTVGVLNARHDCRMEMVKIVNEVRTITRMFFTGCSDSKIRSTL